MHPPIPTLLTTALCLCLTRTLALPSAPPPPPAWLASYPSTTCAGDPAEPQTNLTLSGCQAFASTTGNLRGGALQNPVSAFLFSDPDCTQQNQVGVLALSNGAPGDAPACLNLGKGVGVKSVRVSVEGGGVAVGPGLRQGPPGGR